jgi:hypothetical protein
VRIVIAWGMVTCPAMPSTAGGSSSTPPAGVWFTHCCSADEASDAPVPSAVTPLHSVTAPAPVAGVQNVMCEPAMPPPATSTMTRTDDATAVPPAHVQLPV